MHEILSDGVTVWVNSDKGYCLGRFGRMGIDVHRPPGDTKGECLYCTHAPVTARDWKMFKTQMKRHHNVVVTDQDKPLRLKRRKP